MSKPDYKNVHPNGPEQRIRGIKQTVLMAIANKKPGIKGFKL
jgi:hypothetical protein